MSSKEKKLNAYLIDIYDGCPCKLFAESAIEAIRVYAEFSGQDDDLFKIAMRGITSEQDAIRMYNHFADFDYIRAVYLIAEEYTEETTE